MYEHIPNSLPPDAPLVVVLHGCRQNAALLSTNAGWIKYADLWKFALLLPEQHPNNNAWNCFNWFQPEDTTRNQGEALSIREMIATMQQRHPIDPERIYITGLSAGGAMTAVMLATYPEVFAGGAIIAGIPYGCASDIESAFTCQSPGRDLEPKDWKKHVLKASKGSRPKWEHWPIVSIWQGDQDTLVQPINAQELMEQWTAVHKIDQIPDVEDSVNGYPHRVYHDKKGVPRVEMYTITGMSHGIPIAPGIAESQCGVPAPYIPAVNICASFHIGKFWGLNSP